MPAPAQTTCEFTVKAWVFPTHGDDSTATVGDRSKPFKTLQAAIDAVHYQIFVNALDPATDPASYEQGIVYAMPGLYGDHSVSGTQFGSGDLLPIIMRDRVHVQGAGARRCILRGNGVDNSSALRPCNPYVPMPPGQNTYRPSTEILLTYEEAGEFTMLINPANGQFIDLPWICAGDTAEVFDGFTLQGGDIQVVFQAGEASMPLSGRISNCLFDMRHCIDPEIAGLPRIEGPSIGIQIAPRFHAAGSVKSGMGYHEFKVHVLNNTFVMWDGTTETRSLPATTAIMDVLDPFGVDILDPTDDDPVLGPPFGDEFRGISRLGIQNNLIRTPPDEWDPENPFPFASYAAMLGVSLDDTQVTGALLQTNAFATGRAGQTVVGSGAPAGPCEGAENWSGACSSPASANYLIRAYGRSDSPSGIRDMGSMSGICNVPLYMPAGLPLPNPNLAPIAIWNGILSNGTEFDPAFVGESLLALQAPVPSGYRDFRLLPGSPAMEQGWLGPVNIFQNGETYLESACPDINFMDWDGEGYGNPRVRGQVDIGFDEVDLYVSAGSYANHENSHNNPPRTAAGAPILNNAVGQGQSLRLALFPKFVPGTGVDLQTTATFVLAARERAVPDPSSSQLYRFGWTQPPATLGAPVIDTGAQPGFDKQWLSFAQADQAPTVAQWLGSPLNPTPMTFPSATTRFFTPPSTGQAKIDFLLTVGGWVTDDEGPANYAAWFNTQFQVLELDNGGNTLKYYSNLQVEYR